jgi:predicted Rossmann fold flavoprotein
LVQSYPRGGKALRGAFSRFQPRDTVNWFAAQGVKLKTEADGRIFPVTDDSATIVDCLLQSAQAAGVTLRTRSPVVAIGSQADRYQIHLRSGEVLWGDRVLLATGSSPQGLQFAKTLGHTIVPPVPSLFTFNVTDPRLHEMAGVSVPAARLQLQTNSTSKLEQTGPLLITHWGLSGPAVLKLSAWGARVLHGSHYQATLLIHWLPQLKVEQLREKLLATKAEFPKRTIAAHCPLPLPRRLWQKLMAAVGIGEGDRWADLSNKTLNALLQELTQGKYAIQGKGVFKEEFVTCGGVDLKEVDFKTMESRLCPGLYFAGEVLDIDGVTGGFNFQSAWTTGWLAGQAMAKT